VLEQYSIDGHSLFADFLKKRVRLANVIFQPFLGRRVETSSAKFELARKNKGLIGTNIVEYANVFIPAHQNVLPGSVKKNLRNWSYNKINSFNKVARKP